MSDWVKSDVFIVFVVVMLFTIIVLFSVCCFMKWRRTHRTGKRSEVEIIPSANSGSNNPPKFTVRIITEQKHASELIEMLTGQFHATVDPISYINPGVSAVSGEVASTSQTQLEINTETYCHTDMGARSKTPRDTSLSMPTTDPTKQSGTKVKKIWKTENEEESEC